ncbi:ribokinase [Vallitaleaceae bacterium 9-2]
MKVLNYGSLNVDYVYSVEKLVKPGTTIADKGLKVMSGGKGLNQSVAIAKAGIQEIYHAGNIGRNGDFLKLTLLEHNIKIDYIQKSNSDTGHAIIQYSDEGEHTIIVHGGSNYNNQKDTMQSVLEHFEEGDILLVQNEINDVDYIIDLAYEKNMKIIVNPAPFHESVYRFDFSKVDTLIVNETELYSIAHAASVEEAIQRLQKYDLNIVITLGDKGGLYVGRDMSQIPYKSHLVDVVDTTAVGDAFVGYFVAGLVNGMAIKDILDYSSKAGALAATVEGSAISIPSRREVERLSKEMENDEN